MRKAGFEAVERVEERPFGPEQWGAYPLLTQDLLDLVRRLIPPERQATVARSVTFRARKPAAP